MNNMPNPNLSQTQIQNMQNQRRTQQTANANMQSDFSRQFNNFMPPQNFVQGGAMGNELVNSNIDDNYFSGSDPDYGFSDGVNNQYISALLERYIGKIVKVEFLVGNTLNDRAGRLLSIGEDYIVLGVPESKVIVICSTDDLRFATVIIDEENTDIEF